MTTVRTNPFQNLPPLMIEILNHEENTDMNMAIEKNNGLSRQQGDIMMQIIRKVILKTITPSALLETIKKDVKLDDAASRKLALDLLGRRFLPMQWYIGNVESLIRELGGDPAVYLAAAKKLYPEVYQPSMDTIAKAVPPTSESPAAPEKEEGPMLKDFEGRLSTFRGRAEILLRLTGLSSQVEEGMHSGKVTQKDGEELMRQLDALSYAINTQDLNQLEIQSVKRRLTRIMNRVNKVLP